MVPRGILGNKFSPSGPLADILFRLRVPRLFHSFQVVSIHILWFCIISRYGSFFAENNEKMKTAAIALLFGAVAALPQANLNDVMEPDARGEYTISSQKLTAKVGIHNRVR